jgi:hypothetical protein
MFKLRERHRDFQTVSIRVIRATKKIIETRGIQTLPTG